MSNNVPLHAPVRIRVYGINDANRVVNALLRMGYYVPTMYKELATKGYYEDANARYYREYVAWMYIYSGDRDSKYMQFGWNSNCTSESRKTPEFHDDCPEYPYIDTTVEWIEALADQFPATRKWNCSLHFQVESPNPPGTFQLREGAKSTADGRWAVYQVKEAKTVT